MRWFRSGSAIVVETPAKLNLFLEIHSKRDDGYHELETLMVAITIHDTLVFRGDSGRQVQLDCRWVPGCQALRQASAAEQGTPFGDLPTAADNLAYRAVEKLRESARVQRGARIRLHKRIPLAAGMGGASSDAAAALAAASAAWELNWSPAILAEMAAELGSDVPFFFAGGAAICRGRGELIEPLLPVPLFHFVVVRPRDGLATADVYRACRPPRKPRAAEQVVEAFRSGDPVRLGQHLFNRLQEPASQLSSSVVQLQNVFEQQDVLGHQLSGSGTSYFGLCRHARHARRVAGRLRALDIGAVYLATTTRL